MQAQLTLRALREHLWEQRSVSSRGSTRFSVPGSISLNKHEVPRGNATYLLEFLVPVLILLILELVDKAKVEG